MTKFILLSISIIALFILYPIDVFGCSCRADSPNLNLKQLIKKAKKNSRAVFEGEVIKVEGGLPDSLTAIATLRVKNSWKGVNTSIVIVSASVCPYWLKVGKNYLIYAYGTNKDNLIVHSCSRTKEVNEAIDELTLLGKGKIIKQN
jgi:hypothetical protein